MCVLASQEEKHGSFTSLVPVRVEVQLVCANKPSAVSAHIQAAHSQLLSELSAIDMQRRAKRTALQAAAGMLPADQQVQQSTYDM